MKVWSCFVAFALLGLVACGVELTAKDCRNSLGCERKGLCALHQKQCVANREGDCQTSRFCFDLGLCSLAKESQSCVALTEQDCRGSTECKSKRHCIPKNGICVELTPGHCRRQFDDAKRPTRCKLEGACSLDSINQVCVVRREQDCLASELCKAKGRCSLVQGQCSTSSDRDCRLSEVCAKEGRCHAVPNEATPGTPFKECVALSQDDCEAECETPEIGCAFDLLKRRCVSALAYCKNGDLCRILGRCSWDKSSKRCIVVSDADCKQSRECDVSDRCTHYKGRCVLGKPDACEESKDCLREGKCSDFDGECFPATDADCMGSDLCKSQGRCTVDETSKTCVPATRLHCARSAACLSLGRCTYDLDEQACVIGSPLDCEKSRLCKTTGRCIYRACRQNDIDQGIACVLDDLICARTF